MAPDAYKDAVRGSVLGFRFLVLLQAQASPPAHCDDQCAQMNDRPVLDTPYTSWNVALWVVSSSDLGTFRKLQRILHVNAEITHGALDLSVTEKDLHSPQIAGRLVDDGGFCAPE